MIPWNVATLALALLASPQVESTETENPNNESVDESIVGETTMEVALGAFIEEVLSRHPDLQALDLQRGAAQDRAVAAGSLPHPSLGVALRGVPTNSFSLREDEMTSADVSVRQTLVFPGKRGLRREVSAKDGDVIQAQAGALRLELAEEAASAYAELWLVLQTRRELETQRDALERLLAWTRQRLAVGSAHRGDVLRAEAEIALLDSGLVQLAEQEQVARARLGALLLAEGPWEGEPVLDELPPLPSVERLRAAVGAHPELAELRRVRERAQLEQQLARKEKLPDPEIGVTYGHRVDFPDLVGIEVSIPIPLFSSSKEDRLAAAAAAEADAAARRLVAQQSRLEARLREARAQAEAELERLRLYDDEILPRLAERVNALANAYVGGASDFRDLLDGTLTHSSERIARLRSFAGYVRALAGLARASGDLALLAAEGDDR